MINNISIIIETDNYDFESIEYDLSIKKLDEITAENMKGHVLIKKAYPLFLQKFLELFGDFKIKKMKSITFITKDVESFEDYIQSQLKQIVIQTKFMGIDKNKFLEIVGKIYEEMGDLEND